MYAAGIDRRILLELSVVCAASWLVAGITQGSESAVSEAEGCDSPLMLKVHIQ